MTTETMFHTMTKEESASLVDLVLTPEEYAKVKSGDQSATKYARSLIEKYDLRSGVSYRILKGKA